MNAEVLEHIQLSELPAAWRTKLPKAGFAHKSHVTVRIEQELPPSAAKVKQQAALTALMANPMVGMWADRKDMADVPGYVRALRAPRLGADGMQRKKTS